MFDQFLKRLLGKDSKPSPQAQSDKNAAFSQGPPPEVLPQLDNVRLEQFIDTVAIALDEDMGAWADVLPSLYPDLLLANVYVLKAKTPPYGFSFFRLPDATAGPQKGAAKKGLPTAYVFTHPDQYQSMAADFYVDALPMRDLLAACLDNHVDTLIINPHSPSAIPIMIPHIIQWADDYHIRLAAQPPEAMAAPPPETPQPLPVSVHHKGTTYIRPTAKGPFPTQLSAPFVHCFNRNPDLVEQAFLLPVSTDGEIWHITLLVRIAPGRESFFSEHVAPVLLQELHTMFHQSPHFASQQIIMANDSPGIEQMVLSADITPMYSRTVA